MQAKGRLTELSHSQLVERIVGTDILLSEAQQNIADLGVRLSAIETERDVTIEIMQQVVAEIDFPCKKKNMPALIRRVRMMLDQRISQVSPNWVLLF